MGACKSSYYWTGNKGVKKNDWEKLIPVKKDFTVTATGLFVSNWLLTLTT
jgi:hypothetical protein